MRITDDPAADAVYIHLTSDPLAPGRTTLQAPTPPGTSGFIALDWKDDRLVGIEILDASTRFHHDLLAKPKSPAKRQPLNREEPISADARHAPLPVTPRDRNLAHLGGQIGGPAIVTAGPAPCKPQDEVHAAGSGLRFRLVSDVVSFAWVRGRPPGPTSYGQARSRTGVNPCERWSALLESVLGATPREFESRILRHL